MAESADRDGDCPLDPPGEGDGGEDPELESAPEHLYFLAIEKTFIEERGAPLSLSPKDWHVARRWYDAGVPLEWVERTLREIFDKRRAKGTADKILNLGYCRRSVEAAWKRHQKMEAPELEAAAAIDVASRLAALAAALPAGLGGREAWARCLTELEGGAEAVEEKLKELDRDLLAAASAQLDAAARQEVEADLARALANLARRLPSAELEAAAAPIREQLLREHLALPVLSLFAPEAAVEE